jgi:hypothetical protein
MVRQSGHSIANRAKFDQIITSDRFKQAIAQELLSCFQCMNEGDDEVLYQLVPDLFDDAVTEKVLSCCDDE